MVVMKTLKYKLYKNTKYRRLHKDIDLGCTIYNHCIALHKRYYRLFGKHLGLYKLQKHITRLKRLPKYTHWKELNSQVIQEITERIEKGYRLFFEEKKRGNTKITPPGFRKRRRYRSITFKQSGFAYLGENKVRIGKHHYKLSLSRPLEGKIKTMTLKRDALGDLYLCFSVEKEEAKRTAAPDEAVGFDFGLKTFLTGSDGGEIASPEFFSHDASLLKKLCRRLSSKAKGSNNRGRARKDLARCYRRIADRRRDWFFKQAHALCKKYRLICIEDLDMKSMAKRWGKKIHDYAFSEFVEVLEYVAAKYGGEVYRCDRYLPTSRTCSLCGGYKKELSLKEREWECPQCHARLCRDKNASYNILRAGASAQGLGDVRPPLGAVSV